MIRYVGKRKPRYSHWKGGAWKVYRITTTCRVCKKDIKPLERCFDTGGHIGINETAKYCAACAYEKTPISYGEEEVRVRSRNLGVLGLRG